MARNVAQFFENEAQSILSRYKNIESLIPSKHINKDGSERAGSAHSGEEGRFLEAIIRDLLNKYLPKNLKALTGFILRPKALVGMRDKRRFEEQKDDEQSSQLDIIVYDVANYPVYENYEDFAIVPPEGVIAIISVKKTLRKGDLKHEFHALADAVYLCRHYIRDFPVEEGKIVKKELQVIGPATAIIGFTDDLGDNLSAESKALEIAKMVANDHKGFPADAVINQVSVLDSFTIYRANDNKAKGEEFYKAPLVMYSHILTEEDEAQYHFGIQNLLRIILKHYYHQTRSKYVVQPGFVAFNDDTYRFKSRGPRMKFKERRVTGKLMTEQQKFRDHGERLKKLREKKKDQ